MQWNTSMLMVVFCSLLSGLDTLKFLLFYLLDVVKRQEDHEPKPAARKTYAELRQQANQGMFCLCLNWKILGN